MKQHIGGSYYTIRQILQEMEHKRKMSADSRHGDSQTRKMEKEKFSNPSSDLEENLSSTLEEACSPHKETKETVRFVDHVQNEANCSVNGLEYSEGKESPLSYNFENKSLAEQSIDVVHDLSTAEVNHASALSSASRGGVIDAKDEPKSHVSIFHFFK